MVAGALAGTELGVSSARDATELFANFRKPAYQNLPDSRITDSTSGIESRNLASSIVDPGMNPERPLVINGRDVEGEIRVADRGFGPANASQINGTEISGHIQITDPGMDPADPIHLRAAQTPLRNPLLLQMTAGIEKAMFRTMIEAALEQALMNPSTNGESAPQTIARTESKLAISPQNPLNAGNMAAMIIEVVKDRDGQGAGSDHLALKEWALKNYDSLSEGAKEVFSAYEREVLQANARNSTGLTIGQMARFIQNASEISTQESGQVATR